MFAGYETYLADKIYHIFKFLPSNLISGLAHLTSRVLPTSFDKISLDFKIKKFLGGCSQNFADAHYSWREIFSAQEKQGIVKDKYLESLIAPLARERFGYFADSLENVDYLDKSMYVDINTWLVDDILVKADRMSMASSLELRAPFLDYRIAEFAASLPSNLRLKGFNKKYILKTVIMYKDFNTVIYVDKKLKENNNINLNVSNNAIVPIGIGLAKGNRLWIYNNLTMKIGLYDYAKRELKPLTIPFANNVTSYSSDFNFFQWVDEKGNAYRCDVYGKIKSFGVFPDNEEIQWVSDSMLIYRKANNLFAYDLLEKNSSLIEIEEKTLKNFTYKDQILSIFTDHGITNYKIAVP